MDSRALKSHSARLRTVEVTITHAELLEAASATAENVALATLPAGAWLIDYAVYLTTLFAGGSVSDLDITIGTVAAPTLVCAGIDVDTAGAGAHTHGTKGTRPSGPDFGGVPLIVRFTPVGDSNLNLTAGSLTVKLIYSVPDGSLARG